MPKLSFQYVRADNIETLLEFLIRRFRYHSLEEWDELISQSCITVNGRPVESGHILETRQKIVYHPPPLPEPEIDPDFDIIYEDAQVIAVNKSGNIPTSPSGKYWKNCLIHLLQKKLGLAELFAVHRLDRETSGINLFTKNKSAARALGDDFHAGLVEKEYTTILSGKLPKGDILISAPLRGMPTGRIRIKQFVHAEGRASKTRFQLQAVLPGACLVFARPLTGRTHQIRAHAAYLGHPVIGDRLYGGSEEDFINWVSAEKRDYSKRQLLHASLLTFTHPKTGKRTTLTSSARILMDLFLKEL